MSLLSSSVTFFFYDVDFLNLTPCCNYIFYSCNPALWWAQQQETTHSLVFNVCPVHYSILTERVKWKKQKTTRLQVFSTTTVLCNILMYHCFFFCFFFTIHDVFYHQWRFDRNTGCCSLEGSSQDYLGGKILGQPVNLGFPSCVNHSEDDTVGFFQIMCIITALCVVLPSLPWRTRRCVFVLL